MEKRRLAPLYGVVVAIVWGLSFLSIKVTVAAVPPMTLAAARFVVACAVLPVAALIAGEPLRIRLRDVPPLVLGGVLGVTIYFYCENNGILLLSASESSILIGTIPVVSVLAERIALGTRLSARVYAGALLSFTGVALIVAQPSSGGPGGASPLRGYLYMAGAVAAWVAYTFATRGVSLRYGRLAVTFWQSLFGLAGCLPFALVESPAWRAPGAVVVLNVLYLGRASVFINLIPVVAVIAAFFLLGDRLGWLQLVGGTVTLAGVYLATT